MNFGRFSRTFYDDLTYRYDSYLWSNQEIKFKLKTLGLTKDLRISTDTVRVKVLYIIINNINNFVSVNLTLLKAGEFGERMIYMPEAFGQWSYLTVAYF